MTPEDTRNELTELLRQTREYVRYFEELGVETVASAKTTATDVQVPATFAAVKTAEPEGMPRPSRKPQAIPRAPATRIAQTISQPAADSTATDTLFGELSAPKPSLPDSTESLQDVWRDIGECTRCGLCEGRTQVVNTHGNPKARLMFVGEAPGADEDAQGKPFVGRAGQLLTKMIEAMGLKREEVIIGNVNRCRPPENRQPTLEEAAICRPFLFREIAAVRPDVIVVMGNTALRNLLEIKAGISSVRGRFQDYQGIKVMPTFHPAYLLRDPSKKRETWEDLKKVMEYLDRNAPVSSK